MNGRVRLFRALPEVAARRAVTLPTITSEKTPFSSGSMMSEVFVVAPVDIPDLRSPKLKVGNNIERETSHDL